MNESKEHFFCSGTIKFYDSTKNHFGFIEVQKSKDSVLTEDIYFKDSALRNSSSVPRDGQRIYCFAIKGRKGYYSNDVIKEGELSPSERIEYLEFLFTKDLSLLIQDFYKTESTNYDDEKDKILKVTMDHYKSHDPFIWKFLYEHSNKNKKALLQKYFNELRLSDKLKASLKTDELLTQVINSHSDNELNLVEIVEHLFDYDREELITDDIWIEYLKLNTAKTDYVFKSLQSRIKTGLTTKYYPWSSRNIQSLLSHIIQDGCEIDSDILLQIFDKNINSFIPEADTSARFRSSIRSPFKIFIEKIFSLSFSEKFFNKFTDLFYEFIATKSLVESVAFLTEIVDINSDENNESFIKFKTKVIQKFKSDFTQTVNKQSEKQIVEVYASLEKLGLQKIAASVLSRASKIELHFKTGSFDLDLKNDYKLLNQLSFDAQRKLFRAIIDSVHSEGGNLFWSIVTELKDEILDPKNKGYDPSTVFCMYILLQIKGKKSLANNPLNTSELFRFVYEQLTDPILIEHRLTSYFEGCTGRAYGKNTYSDVWEIKRTKDAPCNFCEGQIMLDQQSQKSLTDEKTKEKKYWCRNSICLLPSRQETTDSNYFSDFLKILGYSDADYFAGYVNGWVNKINTYLNHLSCTQCNQVLKPTDAGSGYYRVSYFQCTNSSCDVNKNNETIYLTHCINPKCEEVIDSRYTTRCSHGWYICPHCYGCCSKEKIQNRINYYQQIGKPYKGATEGHKELGAIYCPECGNSIQTSGNSDMYQKMLNKFKSMKTKHPNIIKCGKRKSDGKYWFLLKKSPQSTFEAFHDKISRLVEIGFDLADDYDPKNEIALVSEKSDTSKRKLTCQNCDHKIDIKKMYKEGDFYRAKAIEKWHHNLFN